METTVTTALRRITLEEIADGAAEELFQDALAEVLRNIQDPNTDWRGKRSISLQFQFIADEKRQVGSILVSSAKKLSPLKGVLTGVYYGEEEGRPVALEQPHQTDMFKRPPAVERLRGA